MTVSVPCTFDLSTFPADNVQCRLTYSSMIFNEQSVNLTWSKPSIAIKEMTGLSEYHMVGRELSTDTAVNICEQSR